METGDELLFSIDANDCLDIVICDEEDVDEWADGEDDEYYEADEGEDDFVEEDRPLPSNYWCRTSVITGEEYRFVAQEDGRYVLLLINWDEEGTEVTVDAAVWKAEKA